MSAAEALPLPEPEEPCRNTSHLPRPLSAADLAAAPPPRPEDRAAHDAALPQLLTQAAWQDTAKPFGLVEMIYDRLDDLGTRFEALVEAADAEATETDREIDWPQNEKDRWS